MKRKHERNKALYDDWMSGTFSSYQKVAAKYGMDTSNAYKMIQREHREAGDNMVDSSDIEEETV